ncbi:site-specific tyrosine recombinase XerC [Mesoterricola silvestris]|uniref:Tyrosine recombinase XerD n=1 Tax=Mesoterricola silvestris TaxID=2927979 RepID=A0AA48GRN0_9BACT|nr:site-specific tyrosine recombinase XerC [Mesoterricola silvestris]BDU74894.1 tyrosine recombinase XerD [Mesoterricola silvestris]
MPRRGQHRQRPPVGDVRDSDSLYHHMLRYLAFLAEKNYSPRTIETRENYLRYLIAWCDERSLTKPAQIDRPILERYQRYLFYYRKADGEPLSTRSQHSRIIPIRHWFSWLVKKGHLLYSPATDLELPRLEKRLPKAILTAREAELVLAVPEVGNSIGLRDRAILETFYSTGMRRLELINLTVHNIDRERGTVMIRQGKGKKDRLIPIGERALAWIERYRDSARPELVTGRDDGTLFLSEWGEAFAPNAMTRLVRIYVERSGVGKKGACHLFRHTMATLMLEGGADIRFIQAMLGHAELSTTEIYTQVSIRLLKSVHAATHPGRLAEAGRHALDPEPTAEALLEALEREADEEGED